MKNPFILSLVVLSVLLVVGIGCTAIQPSGDYEDDRYDRRMSNSNDPYYYNSRPILVQDARTGRYFYVYPSDLYSSNDAYRFDSRYNSGWNNRYYNDYYYAPNNRNAPSRPQLTEEQRKVQREKLEESRKRILGKND